MRAIAVGTVAVVRLAHEPVDAAGPTGSGVLMLKAK
jgi:hypothetical protein